MSFIITILALIVVYIVTSIVESTAGVTGLYILLIGIIVFLIWVFYSGIKYNIKGNAKIKKSKQEVDSLLSNKHGSNRGTWNVEYLGGHPSFNSMNCTLRLYDDLAVLIDYSIKNYGEIFYEDITNIELVSKEYITQSPTLSKVLLFGIASLAMQKETVHQNNFIVISYTDSGINNKIIIKSIQASNIYNTINKHRINYNRNHGVMTPNEPENNIIEQIRELAKLRDDNIISEHEFERKKEELLSKI